MFKFSLQICPHLTSDMLNLSFLHDRVAHTPHNSQCNARRLVATHRANNTSSAKFSEQSRRSTFWHCRASPDDQASLNSATQGSSEEEAYATVMNSAIVASLLGYMFGQADTKNAAPEPAAAEASISSQVDLSLDQVWWPHRHDAKFDKCPRHRGHINQGGDISSQWQHACDRCCCPVLCR